MWTCGQSVNRGYCELRPMRYRAADAPVSSFTVCDFGIRFPFGFASVVFQTQMGQDSPFLPLKRCVTQIKSFDDGL